MLTFLVIARHNANVYFVYLLLISYLVISSFDFL